jgi:hypothetical protein
MLSYTWHVDGGLWGREQELRWFSKEPGSHTVKLEVGDQSGCSGSYSQQIEVCSLPAGTVEVPASICQGQKAHLRMIPSTQVDSYTWYDCDESGGCQPIGEGRDLEYVFERAGSRSIKVEVTRRCGLEAAPCQDTLVKQVDVHVKPVPCIKGPDRVCRGVPATFEAACLGHQWTWYEEREGKRQYVGSGRILTWSFESPATLHLVAMGDHDCEGEDKKDVEVVDKPSGEIKHPDVACALEGVQLEGPPTMTSYEWSASVGSIADRHARVTRWLEGGASQATEVTISLVFTDANGCAGNARETIPLRRFPQMVVDAPKTVCCDCNYEVSVKTATGGALSPEYVYRWSADPPDSIKSHGNTATLSPARRPEPVRGAQAQTRVKIIVSDGDCTIPLESEDITIILPPEEGFVAEQDRQYVNMPVTLTASGRLTNPRWDCSEGRLDGDGYHVQFSSSITGSHVITLEARFGECTATYTQTIEIKGCPTVAIEGPPELCVDDEGVYRTNITLTKCLWRAPYPRDLGMVDQPTFTWRPDRAGEAKIQVTGFVGNCPVDESYTVYVYVRPVISVHGPVTPTRCALCSYTYTVQPPDSVVVSPTWHFSGEVGTQHVFQIRPMQEGAGTVSLALSGPCPITGSLDVSVSPLNVEISLPSTMVVDQVCRICGTPGMDWYGWYTPPPLQKQGFSSDQCLDVVPAKSGRYVITLTARLGDCVATSPEFPVRVRGRPPLELIWKFLDTPVVRILGVVADVWQLLALLGIFGGGGTIGAILRKQQTRRQLPLP